MLIQPNDLNMESQINSGRNNGKPHIWIEMYVMTKGVNFDEVYNE